MVTKRIITSTECDCREEIKLGVGRGWHPLLDDLIYDIQQVLKKTPKRRLEVHQVKEKFGGLRFYVGYEYNGDNTPPLEEDLWQVIRQYEDRSYSTCEVCGESGKPTKSGWIKVFCEGHSQMVKDGKSPWGDLQQKDGP